MWGLSIVNEVEAYLKKDSKKRSWDGLMPENPEKWYMISPQWFKKYVWPADSIMPKFLYYEIIHGIIFVLLGPINILISYIFGYKLVMPLVCIQGGYGLMIRIKSACLFHKMWKEWL